MERWSDGAMERWSDGAMEWWSGGVVKCGVVGLWEVYHSSGLK
jgi:hypothetical protein